MLYGAQGHQVEGGGGKGFGAGVLYIDVRQCKRAGDFAEKCGLLVVGLDQGQGDVRSPDLQGDAGESGAGTQVGNFKSFHYGGHRGTQGKQVAGGKKALAEVAGDDLFFVADGCEIHASVPALEYIDVRRYTLELSGGQDSGFLVASLVGMTTVS